MKKLFVHTTATALLLSQLGFTNTALASENDIPLKSDSTQQDDAPTLVKGDFFYFVKTTVEKIQLLLTTDKVKEAELLAEFAGERIHESRELIKEGKEEEAKETINKALEQMQIAQGQVDVPNTTDALKVVEKEETSGTETTTTEDSAKTEEPKQEESKKLTKEQKEIAKIQHKLNNNLLVLANVLDQVKNPKAKAAIANNIEKSFNKIAEKLEKVLKKTENKETVLHPVITVKYPENTSTEDSTPEVITTITKVEEVEDTATANTVETTTANTVEADDDNKTEAEESTEVENENEDKDENKTVKHEHDVKVKEEKEHKEVKHEEKVKENRGHHYGQNPDHHVKNKEKHQSKDHGNKGKHSN